MPTVPETPPADADREARIAAAREALHAHPDYPALIDWIVRLMRDHWLRKQRDWRVLADMVTGRALPALPAPQRQGRRRSADRAR